MESDTAIAHLKAVQLSLTQQVSLLTEQSTTYTQKAKEALAKHNRILALSALKSRKLTDAALQKRSDALVRIEEVLAGVEQAASDAEIVKSLEGGARTLDTLNREIGGIERVEQVMERVREGLEEVEDVGKVIAEMGAQGVDEEEVQEEFDELLKSEEEKTIKEQADKERERKLEEKHDGLVEELKNVSLKTPEEEPMEELQEAIPS